MAIANQKQIAAKLANLAMWEMVTIETANGSVLVQKLQYGAEAWAQGDNLPAREVGVFCVTALKAFEHQAAILAKLAPVAAETTKTIVADETNLEIAFRQTYANKVALAETPQNGDRWHNALLKAMKVIERNRSIRLCDDILAFVSTDSDKTRYVTGYGCHETCDCKAGISYHSAIYAILTAYVALGTDKTDTLCDFCEEPIDATGIIHRACEDWATVDLEEAYEAERERDHAFEAQEDEQWLYELAAA